MLVFDGSKHEGYIRLRRKKYCGAGNYFRRAESFVLKRKGGLDLAGPIDVGTEAGVHHGRFNLSRAECEPEYEPEYDGKNENN